MIDARWMIAAALLCAAGPAAATRNTFTLRHAPVSGSFPTALVHLPAGFSSTGRLNLVVYFHGNSNCISTTVEARDAACRRGGPRHHTAHHAA